MNKSFLKLDSIFKRYSIEKTDMPKKYLVEGIIYLGLGDFLTFKGEGPTLTKAINNMIKESKKQLQKMRKIK